MVCRWPSCSSARSGRPRASATTWLSDIGVNLDSVHFDLFALSGITTVYFYFQVPLMLLVITPALEGSQAGLAGGG